MKKSILLTLICISLYYTSYTQCVECNGSSSNGGNASVIGPNNSADGNGSTAIGTDAHTTIAGINTIAIGGMVKSNGPYSFVFGVGASPQNGKRLINNIPKSLMIGFNSTKPTLFISSSPTSFNYNKTGRVGIGNVTNPLHKLHIKADAGEAASVLIEPDRWNTGAQASLLLGNNFNGLKANEGTGLTFNTQKNYYFPDGKVSIGRSINPPETELDVAGTVKMTGLRLIGHNPQQGYILSCTSQNGEAEWQDPAVFMQGLWTENENRDIYRMSKVGIGTIDPQEKLDVDGNITLNDAIIGKKSKAGSKWNDPNFLTIKGSESDRAAKIMIPKGFSEEHNAIKIISPGREGGIQFSTEGVINFNIRKNDVVIGRPDHEMEVKVNGKIWAHEMEIQLSDWWDEVFDEDYNLMPLHQLESYIETNRHLPEIPTEEEVLENGIKLGEMNALLLKKIEELTLYIIAQQKQIDSLEKELDK